MKNPDEPTTPAPPPPPSFGFLLSQYRDAVRETLVKHMAWAETGTIAHHEYDAAEEAERLAREAVKARVGL